MKNQLSVCDICGRNHERSNLVIIDTVAVCPECMATHTRVCESCGRRYISDNMSYSPYCPTCYDSIFTQCSRCGETIRRDEACYGPEDCESESPYCGNCMDDLTLLIHGYYYKPEPIFYGSGKRFFGCELEIDGGGELGEHAELIMEKANSSNEHIYAKHDGSLDDGFEIVSHPMSLKYHIYKTPWESIMQQAISLGYRSHQACTCGLHIHVNKDSLGGDSDEIDATIGRILYFIEHNWNELLKFSRRTPGQLTRWANRYGIYDTPKNTYERAKSANAGRYTALNIENENTIEFRMFRGTLNHSTFIATLYLNATSYK